MNQHAPYPDRLVGIAGKLVMDGLEKGWTFSVFEREGKVMVEMTAKPWIEVPGQPTPSLGQEYIEAIEALSDEVAYLVRDA